MNTLAKERGAALIIVLGLVAIVAGWAASAAYEDMLSLRRSENTLLATNSQLACLSALKLGQLALDEDAKDGQTDDLEEAWAVSATPFPLDDGMVMGYIEDSNRYFNLNDLVSDQGVADEYSVEAAKRLLLELELEATLIDALVDWMDADDRPSGIGGMESSAYYDRPYRVKNARLDRWDELRMVAGFKSEILKVLQEVAMVRPVTTGTKTLVNINTASKPVLKMYFPRMTDVDAEAVIENRPYTDLSSVNTEAWVAAGRFERLSVRSDMFILHAEASFGHVNWKEDYLLERKGGKLSLIWRERRIWQP